MSAHRCGFVRTAGGDRKHAGSVVGDRWPEQSSRNAMTVCNWWTSYPDAGIAVHTGNEPSSSVVVDDAISALRAIVSAGQNQPRLAGQATSDVVEHLLGEPVLLAPGNQLPRGRMP
ncbi:bifunctional DNA primase/polymerase [Mycobacterium sp.]|uniref:bifunctional DNA primase/polymerase n=1 Tax=Mycobacterium sp. TaxID=1785 RepID=UPI0039C913E0